MRFRSRATAFGRAVAAEVRETEVPFLAASIAFYAFVALVPLLVLLFVAATLVLGEEVAERWIELTGGVLTPTGQELVLEAVRNAAGRSGATGAGLVLLLWSALRLFRGVDVAFAMVYGVEVDGSFVDRFSTAVIGFLAVTVAVVGMLLLGTLLVVFPVLSVLGPVSPLAIFVMLAVVFLPLYYFVPGADVSVREALPGSLVAALGWTVLDLVFGVYAANAGQYGIYGAAGGVFLLLTWLYVGATALIAGAIVNAALATGGEGTPPTDDAEDTGFDWIDPGDLASVPDLGRERWWAECPECGSRIEVPHEPGERVECPHCETGSRVGVRLKRLEESEPAA